MDVCVEICVGPGSVEMIRRFHLDGREIEVSDTLDQWHGADYRYFKVKDEDDNIYILRFDESEEDWDLIIFKSAKSQATPSHADAHPEDNSEEGH